MKEDRSSSLNALCRAQLPDSRPSSPSPPLSDDDEPLPDDKGSAVGLAERLAMTVVAGYGMVLCGNDDLAHRYRGRIEKVKFGVPINEAFAHDIPATLLVLLLKVNKEGPLKKDIWRAPGNQAQVRKLSHIMQHGRLVNISHFSVYTAASVIKKFLTKLPGGIFGVENERTLFDTVPNQPDPEKQRQLFCRIFCGLPVPSQHLLVLLFGTFKSITDASESFGTKMSPDAIGISVAPSLFHTCITEGQKVRFEDVQRFKVASQLVSLVISSFGHTNLFPRECYEFYARITGRTLRVDENWLFTFQYPSNAAAFRAMAAQCAGAYSLAALHELPPRTTASLPPQRALVRGGSLNRHPQPSTTPLIAVPSTPAAAGASCAATALAAETQAALEELELRESTSCDF